MSDDPLKRSIAMLTEVIETLRGVGVPVPRDAHLKSSNRPKLSQREVTHLRALKRSGLNNREIADVYDINPATVSRIVRGIYH